MEIAFEPCLVFKVELTLVWLKGLEGSGAWRQRNE